MTTLALPLRSTPTPRSILERLILIGLAALLALLATAVTRRLTQGAITVPRGQALWLAVHLAAVLPAVPLGGYVLWARKGDRTHRLLGRIWASLMMATALSSFALRSSGHLSWIHILSAIVLVSVPRGIFLAMRGRIVAHRWAMTRVYAGLVIAGFFTFVPGRLLGGWLFG